MNKEPYIYAKKKKSLYFGITKAEHEQRAIYIYAKKKLLKLMLKKISKLIKIPVCEQMKGLNSLVVANEERD